MRDHRLLTAITALPMVALGGWLGLRLFRRVNQPALRRYAYAFVIVMGVVLFAKTRWGLWSRPVTGSGPADSRPVAVGLERSSARR